MPTGGSIRRLEVRQHRDSFNEQHYNIMRSIFECFRANIMFRLFVNGDVMLRILKSLSRDPQTPDPYVVLYPQQLFANVTYLTVMLSQIVRDSN